MTRFAYGVSTTPPEIIYPDEVAKLYAAMRKHETWAKRNLAMIEMMYRCGLRKGEVLNLTVDDIRTRVDEPIVLVRKTKFDKGRNVPIDPRILPSLYAWEEARPPGAVWYFCTTRYGHNPNISAGNAPGARLAHSVVNTYISRVARRAGLNRRIWPHMFRHTCATNWLNGEPGRETLSLAEVRDLLGHASIAVTSRYVHSDSRTIKAKIYGTSEAIPSAQLAKACVWCAESINHAARKCRYCGELQEEAA